jgi:hypothetical protein
MLALILSIIFPGLGQFYYGKNKRGIAMLILALTPLYPVALVWSVIDILRLNKQGITPKFRFKEAMWSILPFVLIIPLCLFIAFSGMTRARKLSQHLKTTIRSKGNIQLRLMI